jgi:imidazolonepropionase-like amidohydrolase
VDVHVHLSSLPVAPSDPSHPYALVEASRALLAGGITTVRDLGAFGRSLYALREGIEAGLFPGPRLVLCGQVISATCPGAAAFPGMYHEADGTDELRKAVREQVRAGADVVKVMVTGALTVPEEDVNPSQLRREEVEALVDESRRLGVPVAAHAEGAEGIRISVEAGADTIEHGEMGHEVPDVVAAMAERGTVLVPTLCVFDAVADAEGRFPEWVRERARGLRESALKTIELALREGVEIAMGADAGPHGANARELVLLAEAGLGAMEAIVAATSRAARVCGLDAEIGTIEPGKRADLVAVDGDPLADPRVLTGPLRLVLKDGVKAG